MNAGLGRRSGRHLMLVLGTSAMILGAVETASAGEVLQNFFSSIFGGGQQPRQEVYVPAEPQSYRPYRRPVSRPLTVRLHRPKVREMAQLPTSPGKVSIFQDKTLRRGDAVMTRHGVRIFAGSSTWPYQDADFVAIADAGRMDKGVQKTLLSLDSLPRN